MADVESWVASRLIHLKFEKLRSADDEISAFFTEMRKRRKFWRHEKSRNEKVPKSPLSFIPILT